VSPPAAGCHVPVDRRQRMGESARKKKRPQGEGCAEAVLARKSHAGGARHIPTVLGTRLACVPIKASG
jgi:hypothetical protein